MILTTNMLLDKYCNYGDKYGKIARMVASGSLFPLVRGIYEDNPNASGIYLAGVLYGPSYLSFNTALSFHSLIPEAVYDFTSATCEKKKKKQYSNHFGTFTYRDVPTEVFRYGVTILEQEGYTYMMASPEKALCDKLYEMPLARNQKALEQMLFEDMRIDETFFAKLKRNDIYFIAPKYHSTNLLLLEKYLRRINHE